MDTHARTHPDALPAPAWNAYLQEARFEFLRLWRSPSFSLPVLLFPPLFYLLFGEIFGGNRSPEAARYLLAGYSVFGIMGVALFGFGVTVAVDREQGLLVLKRAQPMPPGAYLLAKVAMAMLFSAIVLVLLSVLAATVAGVRLPPLQWLRAQRLQAIRHALQAGEARSISETALRFGFTHLGEFSRAYRKAFGETATQTRGGSK